MKKFLVLLPILCLLSGCAEQRINIEKPDLTEVDGKFYHTLDLVNSGTENTYYQFRSHDDSVWWLLTADEIGHAPDFNTEYRLTFYDNGTTKPHETCDCTADMDCECYLYDDEFISIRIAEK